MTPVQTTLLEFIDERLESLLRVPAMWGSDESVELQVLQLLEIRFLTLHPSARRDVEHIQRDYVRYIQSRFPSAPPEPLAALLARYGRSSELTGLLRHFIEEERQKRQEALGPPPC